MTNNNDDLMLDRNIDINTDPTDGYIALGFDNTRSIVWSVPKQDIVTINHGELHSPGLLVSICGSKYIKRNYADEDGILPKTCYRDLGNEISDSCIALGRYNSNNVRGAGVWKDPENSDVLVVNSKEIFRTDGQKANRINDNAIYIYRRDLGIKANQTPATIDDIQEIHKVIKTFNFSKANDDLLFLGDIAAKYYTGALKWRTHLLVSGEKGSGKSTAAMFENNLLGSYITLKSGMTSIAGQMQESGPDALPSLIDDGEGEKTKIMQHLEAWVDASTGVEKFLGSSNQTAIRYQLRTSGALFTIKPFDLNAAAASRSIQIEMLPLNPQIKTPELLNKTSESLNKVQEIGKKFFMRMLKHWKEFNHSFGLINDMLRVKSSSRFADTYATILSASWVALNDGFITEEEADKYIDKFNLSANIEEAMQSNDSLTCRDHLLNTIIPGLNFNVSELIVEAAKNSKNGIKPQTLMRYGMFVEVRNDEIFLQVDYKNHELLNLFKNSAYKNGQLDKIFMRIPGSEKSKGSRMGGGSVKRPVILPTGLMIKNNEIRTSVREVIDNTDKDLNFG